MSVSEHLKAGVNMSIKTWSEHKAEMKQADRQEWLEVMAISFGMIAIGALFAYLIA